MGDFTIDRARAVLNVALVNGVVEAIPESDAMKVVEAERVVELARQCEKVVHHVGAGKVPNWPKMEAILVEANLLVGANGSGTGQAPTPPPVPVSPPPVPTTSAAPPPPPPVAPAPIAQPAPAVASAPLVPANGEVWTDTMGGQWEVVNTAGGATLQAKVVGTDEVTLIPSGLLKTRVSAATPQPSPEPTSPSSLVPAGAKPGDPVDIDGVTYFVNYEANGLITSPPANTPGMYGNAPVVSTPAPSLPPVAVQATPPPQAPVFQPPPPVPAASPPPIASPPPPSQPQPVAAPVPPPQAVAAGPVVANDEGDKEYAALLDETEALYTPRGMPVPVDLQDPPSGIPENLSLVDGVQLRALHSQYNALAARAKYLHDLEDARARGCDLIRKMHFKPAMRSARAELGASATVTEVVQLAEDNNEAVATWAARKQSHSETASAYKTFFDIYSEHVAVLSRDGTLRETQARGV